MREAASQRMSRPLFKAERLALAEALRTRFGEAKRSVLENKCFREQESRFPSFPCGLAKKKGTV